MKLDASLLGVAFAGVIAGSGAARDQDLGVEAKLDRPAPIYAANDPLSLTVSATRDVTLKIVLVDPLGKSTDIFPRTGERLFYLNGGQTVRIPARGAFTVMPPAGRYELRVIAQAAAPKSRTRSIGHADARLADRELREDHSLFFQVEDFARR